MEKKYGVIHMKHKGYGRLVFSVLLGISLVLLTGCYSLLADWEVQGATSTPTSTETLPAPPVVEEPEVDVPVQRVFKIGEKGPASGLVFYDKGDYSDGWRYLEAAPERWAGSPYDPKAQWGAYPFSMNGAQLGTVYGTGLENSEHIAIYNRHIQANREAYEQLPEAEQVFSPFHDGSVAAAVCLDAIINGFDDWYLPAQDELALMRNNLYKNDLGSFQADLYWSSSMDNDRSGTMVNFWIGAIGGSYSYNSYYIRPIRKF
ncbi:MAG: hypothetical protein VB025_09080 [Sphaerochaeta sp.]|nr:hypothetical protein [Sphaerochaeta sp.]